MGSLQQVPQPLQRECCSRPELGEFDCSSALLVHCRLDVTLVQLASECTCHPAESFGEQIVVPVVRAAAHHRERFRHALTVRRT